ncbi:hypothetical protein FB451DRAFT_1274400 [Mycena latifolia]|nr:hypothetical protein FB451DRAFT_1274400 [Mycena latifolia]
MGPLSTPEAPFISRCPALPPEITDSIIHELAPDFRALRICSLVCHAWLPASRYILHKALSIRGEDIAHFLELIAPPENTYFPSLRSINISLCENGPTPALLHILPCLSCLTAIRISASLFHYDEFPTLPRLRTLELVGVQFRSFASFTDLIFKVPHLKSLSIEKTSWGSAEGWAPSEKPDAIPSRSKSSPRLELDTFRVDLSDNLHFLEWLRSEETGPLACTLALTMLGPKYILTLPDEMLAAVSEYLRHLNVHLKNLFLRSESPTQIATLDFSANTALRSLRLDLLKEDTFHTHLTLLTPYLFEHLPDVLQRFRSTCIEELILDISLARDYHGSSRRLVSVLSEPPFSRLRKLQFNGPWADGRLFREAFTLHVIDKLPVYASRVIVLFDPATEN